MPVLEFHVWLVSIYLYLSFLCGSYRHSCNCISCEFGISIFFFFMYGLCKTLSSCISCVVGENIWVIVFHV